jgi:hypothetical protein
VAAVLGIDSASAEQIIAAVSSSGGDTQTAQNAVVSGVVNAGGDPAAANQTFNTGATTSTETANNILNGALNQTVTGGGLQNQTNTTTGSP